MNTPAEEHKVAEQLAKELHGCSTYAILAGVLHLNGSRSQNHKLDAIRICILVKKIIAGRQQKAIPGSVE